MKSNEELIVKIDAFDHQGRGIARMNGMTIFVSEAIPGEEVKIKITKVKKTIAEAIVIEFIKASDIRVKPECPYYGLCGGCDLMHLQYKNQIQYKENKIKEIMIRYGNVEIDLIKPMIQNEEPYFYRNKVTFQVKEIIGLYQKKSYDIISIDACIIANPKINQILKLLKTIPLEHVTQIVVRSSKEFKQSMVVIYCYDEIDEELFLKTLKDSVTSIVINNGREKVLYGEPVIYEKIKEKTFAISPSSFFQVNTLMATKLYEKVLEYASLNGKENVLDLYCGTGTIGIFLSDKAKEVIGIEINPDAVENARKNKELNGKNNVTFLCGDVSKLISKIEYKPNVIVVDPPRSGLDEKTRSFLLKMLPKRIVYVSCDPMTLARDLKELQHDYYVVELTPIDMFSNTHHVESVSVLERKNVEK